MELFRSMIDHRKVFVLALNGPAVGGGAAWFEGIADIVVAAKGAYMQVPFSSLGLVPEFGAAPTFARNIGARRANDFLMFGRKCSVEEMESWGLINRIFPAEGFHERVRSFLKEQLAVNDGKSMMETKRLQNAPLRGERILAMFDAAHALAERFVDGAPVERFRKKTEQLSKGKPMCFCFVLRSDVGYSECGAWREDKGLVVELINRPFSSETASHYRIMSPICIWTINTYPSEASKSNRRLWRTTHSRWHERSAADRQ